MESHRVKQYNIGEKPTVTTLYTYTPLVTMKGHQNKSRLDYSYYTVFLD